MSQKLVKVRVLSPRCGHNFNEKGQQTGEFANAIGDIIDMPEDEAQRNIAKGIVSRYHENTKQ